MVNSSYLGGIFAYAPYPVGGQLPRSQVELYGLFLTNLTLGIAGVHEIRCSYAVNRGTIVWA
jgi:hypothetical protein